MALSPDTPAVRLHNAGADCQPQSRAGGWSLDSPGQPNMLHAIELVKDGAQLVRRNTDAAIYHANLDGCCRFDYVRAHHNWRFHRGIFERIFQQIRHHLLKLRVVNQEERQVVGEIKLDLPSAQLTGKLKPVEDYGDHVGERIPAPLRHRDARLKLGEIEEIAHKPAKAVRAGLDRIQKFVTVRITPDNSRLQETSGGGLNGGQRRAQIMRDGAEESVLEPVALAQRLGMHGGLLQCHAINGQRNLVAEGSEQRGLRVTRRHLGDRQLVAGTGRVAGDETAHVRLAPDAHYTDDALAAAQRNVIRDVLDRK